MYLFSDTDERLISPGMGEEARHRGNVYCNLKTIEGYILLQWLVRLVVRVPIWA